MPDRPEPDEFPHRLSTLVRWLGYVWAGPNTLFGLLVGWLLGGQFHRVDGVIEIEGPRIARWLKRLPVPAAAMTMGHVVFGQNQFSLDRTRAHERVHVGQYARWGPFFLPAYLGCSLALYLVRRDGYRENPFEVKAYAVDDPTAASDAGPMPTKATDDSSLSTDQSTAIHALGVRCKQVFKIVLPVLLLVGCWFAFQTSGDDLVRLRERLGWVAPAATVPLHAIIAAAPVPSDVIVIANGALYPYPLAVFLGWLGWLLGSTIEFLTIRLLTGVESVADAKKKMPAWLARWPAGSPWFLILGRQIPGVGAHLTAGVAAAAGVSFGRYLVLTAIAIVPGALLLSAIGAKWLPT